MFDICKQWFTANNLYSCERRLNEYVIRVGHTFLSITKETHNKNDRGEKPAAKKTSDHRYMDVCTSSAISTISHVKFIHIALYGCAVYRYWKSNGIYYISNSTIS